MQIEMNLTETGTFGDLKEGDTFVYDDEVYMVLNRCHGLGQGWDFDGYAVLLKSGNIYGFENVEQCKRYRPD